MSTSEKPTLWRRLSDRSKLPRRLWYPEEKPTVDIEIWERQFPGVSDAIRRTMLTLVAYSFFCLLTLGQSYKDIFEAGGVKIPFANTTVAVRGFLIVGPLVLVGLAVYLHIFVGRWETLRRGHDPGILVPPYLFNLANPFAALLSWLIFYLLVPAVLFSFTWKAVVAPETWRITVWAMATLCTILMMFLALRRAAGSKRILLWLALMMTPVVGLGVLVMVAQGPTMLDLRGAQLKETDLSGFHLWEANLRSANLFGAKLIGAEMRFADLRASDLRYADLSHARLWAANLREAKLGNADLRHAGLRDADLRMADLRGADLRRAGFDGTRLAEADLSGADLRGAVFLNCYQLTSASNWQRAYRDLLPDSHHGDLPSDCGAPIPEPPDVG